MLQGLSYRWKTSRTDYTSCYVIPDVAALEEDEEMHSLVLGKSDVNLGRSFSNSSLDCLPRVQCVQLHLF